MRKLLLIASIAVMTCSAFSQSTETVKIATRPWVNTQLQPITNRVTALYDYLTGSNVWFSVTNYQRTATGVIPTLSLHEIRDGVHYTVWDEEERIAVAESNAVAIANAYADANKADKAWSLYASGTGIAAPSNTTWISTPTTVIAGGLEYAKFITTDGFVSVLTSNGMTANMAGTTNGFLRISNDAGDALLEFRSSTGYTVGCSAVGIEVSNNGAMVLPYNVASESHPIIYTSNSLTGQWKPETDAACLHNVTWTGQSGAWVATVTPKATMASAFVKAEYIVQGGNIMHSDGRANFSGGIQCTDGIHFVRPVYNAGTITWEVVP